MHGAIPTGRCPYDDELADLTHIVATCSRRSMLFLLTKSLIRK